MGPESESQRDHRSFGVNKYGCPVSKSEGEMRRAGSIPALDTNKPGTG
jgi:hypothetical protein